MDQGNRRFRVKLSQLPVDESGALGTGREWALGWHAQAPSRPRFGTENKRFVSLESPCFQMAGQFARPVPCRAVHSSRASSGRGGRRHATGPHAGFDARLGMLA